MNECYRSTFYGQIIEAGHSDHHSYEFVDTNDYGLSLFLDGIVQSSERDQALYHSRLVAAALEEQPAPRDVLIIGGAGGGILHYLASHVSLEKMNVVIVDIDEKLFSIAKRRLSKWHNNELGHRNVKVLHEDGAEFLRRSHDRYDAIILDLGDAVRETRSHAFYTPPTLRSLASAMRSGGVVAFHSAEELTLHHAFVSAFHQNHAPDLGKLAHFPVKVPCFERTWMFNTLKKVCLSSD